MGSSLSSEVRTGKIVVHAKRGQGIDRCLIIIAQATDRQHRMCPSDTPALNFIAQKCKEHSKN